MHATDPKNDSIRAFIKGTNTDIVGMAEMGICWHRLPTKDRIWERTRGWFETMKTVMGYNRQEQKPKPVQWGGTAMWSLNNAAHRATEPRCERPCLWDYRKMVLATALREREHNIASNQRVSSM
jgi:hypothetical protein